MVPAAPHMLESRLALGLRSSDSPQVNLPNAGHITSRRYSFAVLWRKRHKTIFERRRYLGGMPRAEIASKQAIFTLSQLHAELAGSSKTGTLASKIKTAMMQVKAVLLITRTSISGR